MSEWLVGSEDNMAIIEKDIPYSQGRKLGPDARVRQDEDWSRTRREEENFGEEWWLSTMPLHSTQRPVDEDPDVITTAELNHLGKLQVTAFPALSGVLFAEAVRLKINNQDTNDGTFLDVCIYQAVASEKSRTMNFVKVPQSGVRISPNKRFLAAPLDFSLKGTVKLYPGRQYFLGWKSNAADLRIPVANCPVNADIGVTHLPTFLLDKEEDEVPPGLPGEITPSEMIKFYGAQVPWITYVSRNALQFL